MIEIQAIREAQRQRDMQTGDIATISGIETQGADANIDKYREINTAIGKQTYEETGLRH